jgi:glycosyltransferase involved in cell wall biosynthesis
LKQVTRRNVALVHPFDAHAGSQRVAQQVREALNSLGHRCRVHLGFGTRGFVSTIPEVSRFLPIDDIPWRKRLYALWIVALIPRMLWAAARREIVWANTVHAIPAVLPALWLAPRRVVLHLHEIEFPGLFQLLTRWATRRGAHVICVSDFHRRELELPAEVLHNCVALCSNQAPADPPILLFVGTMSRQKGFDLFVKVVRAIKPGTVRAVACIPGVPAGATELDTDAREAGIELRCGISDPADMYPGAALLLQCTDPTICTETFSLVMAEALACGVPVGTTGMKVAAEILGDAWAFDVPGRDPHRIADQVSTLFADPARLQVLREAARERRVRYAFPAFRERVGALLQSWQGDNA